MTTQPSVDKKTGFKLFLEGVQVPFNTITISEAEGNFPTAAISFPAASGALRILPSTIVQIFGPKKDVDSVEQEVLLFEGETSGIEYTKSADTKTASLICNSLLSTVFKATIRPSDSLVTSKLARQMGGDVDSTKILAKISNNSQIAGPLTNEFVNIWQAESKGIIDDKLSNVILFTKKFLDFNFTDLMSIPYVIAGDFLPLPQFFFRYFEKFDPYFGVQSLSYHLTKSIFAFPNTAKVTPFLNKVLLANIKTMFSLSTNHDLSLTDCLSRFMEIVAYSMISPAAYTSTNMFWGKSSNDLGYQVPIRSYFLPDLANSPPAKFNVIFPNQIYSFNYARDMVSEKTRMVGEVGLPFDTPGVQLPIGAMRTHVVPEVKWTKNDTSKLHGGLTIEESYRGINPGYQVMDGTLSAALYSGKDSLFKQWQRLSLEERTINPLGTRDWESKETSANAISKVNFTTGFEDSFEQMVAKTYFEGKYGQRNFSVQCKWNPNRVVGVPGLVLDIDGPSVFGVISSITTNISAEGAAISSVTFRSPRFINTHEMGGAFQEASESLDQYVINDFTNDGALSINNFLFDAYFYDFLNIGFNVYSYLAVGKENKTTKPFSSYGVSTGVYSRFSKVFNSDNWERTEGDYSILDVIRDPVTHAITDTAATFASSTITEIQYAKYLYYAVNQLINKYNAKKNAGTSILNTYINKFTSRNLLNRSDYFNFIGVESNLPTKSLHYKDGVTIFSSPISVVNFKEEYEKMRSMERFLKEGKEDPDIVVTNQAPGKDTEVLEQQIIRMEDYNSSFASWLRIFESKKNKTRAVRIESGGKQIEVDVDVPLLDIASIGIADIYQKSESQDAFFEESFPSWDTFSVYDRRYALDIDRAWKDYDFRSKIIEKANEDLSKRKNGDFSTVNNNLDSKVFMPYNITRYAHVKLAFKNYIRRSGLTLIKG